MGDKPYKDLHLMLNRVLDHGGTFWGKFTCGHCGSRQTFEVPNAIFTSGKCEECGEVTKLRKWGVTVLLDRSKIKQTFFDKEED